MKSINASFIRDFVHLARLDKPIGIYLLLWPVLWALWLAAHGVPSIRSLATFSFGVILMRSAGCIINDYADRHFDGHVKRTANRPLPSGRITEKEALIYFTVCVITAFLLVLTTNALTIKLSFIGLLLASVYPFTKRYTHLPQVVLGAAFSWSIPMAFSAECNCVPAVVWPLFAANLFWTVAYDTQYAMVDRDDDLKIGVKSTAIFFGRFDNMAIALLQGMTVITLGFIGLKMALGWLYYLSLALAAILFLIQQKMTRNRERDTCFKAFLSNHWIGMIIFIGIALSY
ncbi:MAG: 4-hydroxybenzoate octaprenyltransferase [Endozoicomonas sp. (ex Botrylloides leachii)]|nr:4-hydroxybenzoate octaprenyltransferase [Endozoicomonas sp. (ex Botrylloides leachii)]